MVKVFVPNTCLIAYKRVVKTCQPKYGSQISKIIWRKMAGSKFKMRRQVLLELSSSIMQNQMVQNITILVGCMLQFQWVMEKFVNIILIKIMKMVFMINFGSMSRRNKNERFKISPWSKRH